MWFLTITNPGSEPLQIKLVPGKMLIGRAVTSDIVITDVSASRRHAEIYYDPLTDLVTVNDLKSSNGTYINRQKISGFFRMQDGDVIRIGQTVMHLGKVTEKASGDKSITGTRQFTRELVLEAVDEHPIELYEITEKLNSMVDVDSTLNLVAGMLKQALGVDVCEIVLAQDFGKIEGIGNRKLMVDSIQNSSVESNSLAMCVPVVSAGKPLALIYLEKTRADARPFEKRDLQLTVAMSHQTALTLQRIDLLEKVRREGQVKQLLLRFVSPIEAEDVLKDYLKTGQLPELTQKKVTVLFVEIADLTGLEEQIGAKSFSDFVNAFYQYATQVVFRRGGMVKYLGDGVLAVFMETKDGPAPEHRAVSVGREIIDYMKRGDLPWVVGVAINSGKAMVGYVGSQERAEFNVLGNLIKVTYRMQEYALPNRIFIGASTAEALQNQYPIGKAGNLAMRGSDQPVEVFEISLAKTSPFIQSEEVNRDKDSEMSAAFKAIAEKLRKARRDRGEEDEE
jgi:class 3 adenylate cyclase